MTPVDGAAGRAGSRGLWVGVVVGAPLIGWAVVQAVETSGDTHPPELAGWIVGTVVVVDLVVIPLALVVGRLVRDVALRWTLATSGTVVLVGWPFIQGYGRSAGNPSLLPRDYGEGVAVAIGVVWAVGIAWVAARHRRVARGPVTPPAPGAAP